MISMRRVRFENRLPNKLKTEGAEPVIAELRTVEVLPYRGTHFGGQAATLDRSEPVDAANEINSAAAS